MALAFTTLDEVPNCVAVWQILNHLNYIVSGFLKITNSKRQKEQYITSEKLEISP